MNHNQIFMHQPILCVHNRVLRTNHCLQYYCTMCNHFSIFLHFSTLVCSILYNYTVQYARNCMCHTDRKVKRKYKNTTTSHTHTGTHIMLHKLHTEKRNVMKCVLHSITWKQTICVCMMYNTAMYVQYWSSSY